MHNKEHQLSCLDQNICTKQMSDILELSDSVQQIS